MNTYWRHAERDLSKLSQISFESKTNAEIRGLLRSGDEPPEPRLKYGLGETTAISDDICGNGEKSAKQQPVASGKYQRYGLSFSRIGRNSFRCSDRSILIGFVEGAIQLRSWCHSSPYKPKSYKPTV